MVVVGHMGLVGGVCFELLFEAKICGKCMCCWSVLRFSTLDDPEMVV